MAINIRTGFFPVLLLTLAFLITGSCLPEISRADMLEGVLAIETIGTGSVNEEDPSSAELTAINNALEAAIDEGIATVMPSEILADNFEEITAAFYGSAKTFIFNYQTLAIAKSRDYCRVLVRSSISAGAIKERIRQIGVIIDRDSSPRLLILLSEEMMEQSATYRRPAGGPVMSVAARSMAENFTKRGIMVVPPDRRKPGMDSAEYMAELNDEKVCETGSRLGVDFAIIGKSYVMLTDKPEKGENIIGAIDARLLDINTGITIFRTGIQRQAEVSATSPDELGALAAAGKEAARQFSPAIITAFEQQKSMSRVYQIRIQGAGYLAHLNAFRNLLNAIDDIKRPQVNEMKIDEAVISVDFSGTARDLARTLAGMHSDVLTITVMDVLKESVVVELTSAGMTAD